MRGGGRKKAPRLEIQVLGPATNAQNLHNVLPQDEWKKLSRKVAENANGLCEICGEPPSNRNLACHERWSVDPKRHIQKLIALQAVCAACHHAIHYGRAHGVSYKNAFDHICRVNNWATATTRKYIREIEKTERKLPSNFLYAVDMSYVERYGVKLLPRYSSDCEDVTPFAKQHLKKLTDTILRLSKPRRIVVFHYDMMFICCRIDIDTTLERERKRLLKSLPKMNSSRSHLVGIYSRSAYRHQVRKDLLAEFSRCEKLASAKAVRNIKR